MQRGHREIPWQVQQASTLLAKPLRDEQLRSLRGLIDQRSSHVDGNDFWVDGRPFILTVEPDDEGKLEEYAEFGLCDALGWTVEATVALCPMCNQDDDHRRLGELCVSIAKQLGGIIHFASE